MAEGSNSLRFLREQARLPLSEAGRLLGVSGLMLSVYEGQLRTVPDDLLERVWRVPEVEPEAEPDYIAGVTDDQPPPAV